MCKLFMLTNATKINNRMKLAYLIRIAQKTLTVMDRDGFGYAIASSKGVYGGRFVDLETVSLAQITDKPEVPEGFRSIFRKQRHEYFGEYAETEGGLIIHARMSTNTINLKNTHPHRNDDWTLIHNGMVYNDGEDYTMNSTCDSEHLLHHLTEGGINGVTQNISGWYAFGALNNKTRELLIMKDATTQLYGCYVRTIESLAFATSESHLEDICRAMHWQCSETFKVEQNIAAIFDIDGTLLKKITIEPKVKEWPTRVTAYNSAKEDDDYYDKLAKQYAAEDIPTANEKQKWAYKDGVWTRKDAIQPQLSFQKADKELKKQINGAKKIDTANVAS